MELGLGTLRRWCPLAEAGISKGCDRTGSISIEKAAKCDQLLLQEGIAPDRVKKPGWSGTVGSGNWWDAHRKNHEKRCEPLYSLPPKYFHIKCYLSISEKWMDLRPQRTPEIWVCPDTSHCTNSQSANIHYCFKIPEHLLCAGASIISFNFPQSSWKSAITSPLQSEPITTQTGWVHCPESHSSSNLHNLQTTLSWDTPTPISHIYPDSVHQLAAIMDPILYSMPGMWQIHTEWKGNKTQNGPQKNSIPGSTCDSCQTASL